MKRFVVPALVALVIIAPLALTGCGKTVTRVDNNTDINLSGNWNDADAKMTADDLVAKCLAGPWSDDFKTANGKKPVVKVGRFVVRADGDIINAPILTNKLIEAIVTSGKARAVADQSGAEDIRQERAEQEKNASETTRKESFQEIGADFKLQGEINVQNDQDGDKKVKFYQIVARLTDVTTGEITWQGSHEVKKYVER